MDHKHDALHPLLSYGFRPFFLFAGLYAVVALAAWLVWLGLHMAGAAVTAPSFAVAPHQWHGHELVFGYGAAALAGFMLTAVPNWTNTEPLRAAPLAFLAALWLAGRFVMWFSALLPALAVALIDLAFLPALAVFVARALSARPAPRNIIFVALLAVLFAANLAVHLEWTGHLSNGASPGLAAALLTLSLMVSIIGGRVVPAFTRNALAAQGERERLPRSFAPLDALALISTALLIPAVAFAAPPSAVAPIALVAAVSHLGRLAFWRWPATLRSPILWSLHLAYLWLPIGFALLALSALDTPVTQSAALHALAVGAIGGMTLAVMTRAALGHTGRPLIAPRPIAWAYGLIACAALLRSLASLLLPEIYLEVVVAAGLLWMIGFALFAAVYWPVLTGPTHSPAGQL